jgi:hypothetical protein
MGSLYPEIEPYDTRMLDVGDGNLIYWEVCGTSAGKLLEAVIDRFADATMATLTPILDDPDLPALRKLERALAGRVHSSPS